MSDTLTNGPSPEATELKPETTSEDTVRQMVAAHETEETVPAPETPVVEVAEPTTVDLEAQLAQPAVEDEARDPQPNQENVTPATSEHVLDLTENNKADASARLNEVYSNESAVATEEIAKTVPGSPEEKAALADMKARIAPQVNTIQEEKLAATRDVTEKPAAKKRSLLHPSTWL